MKHLFLTLFLFFISFAMIIAQENQYETAMQNNIQILDTAESENVFKTLANNFERIAFAEKDKWLPHYYVAFSKINQAIYTNDISQVDILINKADDFIKKAEQLSSDNSEIYVLKALAYSSRIRVDFMVRGPQYVTKSNSYLRKASELDRNNPRAYYLLGQNVYNTPVDFGGGAKSARKLFDVAAQLFKNNTSTEKTIYPHWGRESLEEILLEYTETYNED
ncbi:MAG: hypothetical protein AAGI07_01320 [Bacteroidota bacterium]